MTTLADVARGAPRPPRLGRRPATGARTRPTGLAEARKAARPWTGEPIAPTASVKGDDAATAPSASRRARDDRSRRCRSRALNVRQVERLPRAALGADTPRGSRRRVPVAPRDPPARRAARREVRARAARARARLVDARVRRRTSRRSTSSASSRSARPSTRGGCSCSAPRSAVGIGELLAAEDAWVDLEEATITMPEWATKERREKVLDLLPEECDLIREQRLVRSPNTVVGFAGSLLLFPQAGRHALALPLLVLESRHRPDPHARPREHGARSAARPADAPTPFDHFKPKDLRRGAATLMRELGISPGARGVAARSQGRRSPARHGVRRDEAREPARGVAGDRRRGWHRRAPRLEAALVKAL